MNDGIVGGNRSGNLPGGASRLPNSVEAMLRQIRQENATLADNNRRLQNDLADTQARVAEALGQMRTPEAITRPRTIAEIPGPRSWRMYVLRIPFTYQETGMQQATVEISTDGPFVLTDTSVCYQVNDTTNAPAILQKRVLPCTTYWPNTYQIAATSPTILASSAGAFVPELFFQVRVDGSGRYWTNNPVPAAVLCSWGTPKFSGIETWVESKNRLIIEATPQFAMPVAGECIITFSGYQILGNISIAEILGYAA